MAPITGDELVSDAFPMTVDEEHGALKFEGAFREFEVDEGGETVKKSLIDVVHRFQLNKNEIKKAELGSWAKTFMPKRKKQLEENKPAAVQSFMDNAKKFMGWVLSDFDNFDFYIGQSGDPDDMMLFCRYSDDGVTPYFYIIPDSCDDMKC